LLQRVDRDPNMLFQPTPRDRTSWASQSGPMARDANSKISARARCGVAGAEEAAPSTSLNRRCT
jgi:hypothetical protein